MTLFTLLIIAVLIAALFVAIRVNDGLQRELDDERTANRHLRKRLFRANQAIDALRAESHRDRVLNG